MKFVSTCFEHQKLSGYGAHGVNVLLSLERTPVDAYEIAHVRENFRFLFAACKRVNLFYFETNKFNLVQKDSLKKKIYFFSKETYNSSMQLGMMRANYLSEISVRITTMQEQRFACELGKLELLFKVLLLNVFWTKVQTIVVFFGGC